MHASERTGSDKDDGDEGDGDDDDNRWLSSERMQREWSRPGARRAPTSYVCT